jgi:DNA-binding GntR family transcriptional regulator
MFVVNMQRGQSKDPVKRTGPNVRNQSGPERGLGSGSSDSKLLLAAPAARVSLGEVVAERLRQAILDDELHPGQHLREDEISEMLEVSRGPVRVALLILQHEGLVDLTPHRGATVARLSIEDVGEIYSLRSALETLAIRLAIRRGEPADLDALEESLAELRVGIRKKPTDAVGGRLDLGFHDNIFKAAHHERLHESWRGIRMQVYWCMLSRKPAASDWSATVVEEHRQLLEAIRSGRESVAAASMAEHISGAYNRICAQLFEPEPSPAPSRSARAMAETFLLL